VWLRQAWLTAWLLAASLIFSPLLPSQEASIFSDTSGPDSPFAMERDLARHELSEGDRLVRCRGILREGVQVGQFIEAIDTLAAAREKTDIALIAPYIVYIQPEIAFSAMQALRSYGKAALTTVDALGQDVIDAPTKKKVRERLLKDHIYACCQRDRSVNPYQIDYEGRFDELYSIEAEIDTLMLNMLREAMPDLRQDLSGSYFNRRYYGMVFDQEPSFLSYGALAVAALARRNPALLKREVWELAEGGKEMRGYYYGNQVREPLTREVCFFLARNGKSEPLMSMIGDLEMSNRWISDPGYSASVHVEIAACLMAGGLAPAKRSIQPDITQYAGADVSTIIERLDAALQLVGPQGMPVASHARYLKARLLMHQGDDGGALRELEESMESSDDPLLLLTVDSAFKALAGERRFQNLLAYAALIERRVAENLRPFKSQDR